MSANSEKQSIHSIYQYLDAAAYLTEAFNQKQKRNPGFSLRAWAQALGMKSHGPLHAMIKGQRSIPKKYLPKLIKSLELEGKEAFREWKKLYI